MKTDAEAGRPLNVDFVSSILKGVGIVSILLGVVMIASFVIEEITVAGALASSFGLIILVKADPSGILALAFVADNYFNFGIVDSFSNGYSAANSVGLVFIFIISGTFHILISQGLKRMRKWSLLLISLTFGASILFFDYSYVDIGLEMVAVIFVGPLFIYYIFAIPLMLASYKKFS